MTKNYITSIIRKRNNVYKWFQSIFGLNGISPDELSDGLVALMSDTLVDAAGIFTNYILETFVGDNSSFPLYL